MTGIEPILVYAGMSASTAAAISSVVSVGTALFGLSSAVSGMQNNRASSNYEIQALQQQTQGEITAARYNSATEKLALAQKEQAARREQLLRAGNQVAQSGAQGRGTGGNALDIMADSAYQTELDILGGKQALALSESLYQSKVASAQASLGYTSAAKKMSSKSNILSSAPTIITSATAVGDSLGKLFK